MTDDDTYSRVFPIWQKIIESLPGLGASKTSLLRVWYYDEIERYPAPVVLWQIARGLLPVRNFGRLGQERLREALLSLGIPEPKDDAMPGTDWAVVVEDTMGELLDATIEMAAKINELNARVAALEAAPPAPQEEPTP